MAHSEEIEHLDAERCDFLQQNLELVVETMRRQIDTKMQTEKKTGEHFMPIQMDLNLPTKLIVPSSSGNYEEQGWTTIEIGPNDINSEELKDSFI